MDAEKFRPYIGRPMTWKVLIELGIVEAMPPLPPRQSVTYATRICTECDGKHYALGLCKSHYLKAKHKVNVFACDACSKRPSILWKHETLGRLCAPCVQKQGITSGLTKLTK